VGDNFEQSLALVLRHEGGFVNHPRDPGGITNLGVTKSTYENWLGRKVTKTEMQALTLADVEPIYKTNYWDKIRGKDLPYGVDYAMFDFAVNSGTRRAARTLQQLVGVHDDGIVGPFTLGAVKAVHPNELLEDLCNARMEFLRGLEHWDTFGRGWTRRINEVKTAAEVMLAQFASDAKSRSIS
jgi:lysozyme family protein